MEGDEVSVLITNDILRFEPILAEKVDGRR